MVQGISGHSDVLPPWQTHLASLPTRENYPLATSYVPLFSLPPEISTLTPSARPQLEEGNQLGT